MSFSLTRIVADVGHLETEFGSILGDARNQSAVAPALGDKFDDFVRLGFNAAKALVGAQVGPVKVALSGHFDQTADGTDSVHTMNVGITTGPSVADQLVPPVDPASVPTTGETTASEPSSTPETPSSAPADGSATSEPDPTGTPSGAPETASTSPADTPAPDGSSTASGSVPSDAVVTPPADSTSTDPHPTLPPEHVDAVVAAAPSPEVANTVLAVAASTDGGIAQRIADAITAGEEALKAEIAKIFGENA